MFFLTKTVIFQNFTFYCFCCILVGQFLSYYRGNFEVWGLLYLRDCSLYQVPFQQCFTIICFNRYELICHSRCKILQHWKYSCQSRSLVESKMDRILRGFIFCKIADGLSKLYLESMNSKLNFLKHSFENQSGKTTYKLICIVYKIHKINSKKKLE